VEDLCDSSHSSSNLHNSRRYTRPLSSTRGWLADAVTPEKLDFSCRTGRAAVWRLEQARQDFRGVRENNTVRTRGQNI
jgi:hypothetical protein